MRTILGVTRQALPLRPLLPFALCVLSAGLSALACPPVDAWPLTFLAFVPFLAVLRGRGIAASVGYGAAFGLASSLFRFGWMITVFSDFVDHQWALTAILSVLFFAIDAARFGVVGLLVGVGGRLELPVAAVFPMGLLVAERLFTRLHPWAVGYTLASAPLLPQAADLGGVPLLSFAVGLTNALVYEMVVVEALRRVRAEGGLRWGVLRWRAVLEVAAIPALLALYGAGATSLALAREERAAPLEVGIVQANMPAGAEAMRVLDAYEDASVRFVAKRDVDLLVWPESTLDYPLDPERLDDSLGSYLRLSIRTQGRSPALIVGGLIQKQAFQPAENSAILVDRDRHVRGWYGKVDPMPFGEYLPMARYFPGLRDYFPHAGMVLAAEAPAFLEFRGHRIQPRICFEETLPEETRDAVARNAPELLVGMTDDVWFGASPASELHLAIARLRAIEHRRYVVRAVNDGPSAIIDSLGRITHVAPVRATALLAGTVRWLQGTTLYGRFGAAAAWTAALGVGAVALFRNRATSRRRGRCRSPESS